MALSVSINIFSLSRNIQTFTIEIFKFWNGLSPQIMNEVFQVKSPAPYYLRNTNELYKEKYKENCEKYKKMETKFSMSVMQNLLVACWFFIITTCGTEIKKVFILLFICYIINVFSFSFMFFPHLKVHTDLL